MPKRDGTGPSGGGSRTGRGMGNCADQGGTGTGRGLGRGLRRGNGGRGYNSGANSSQGNSWLQTQLENLQNAIQRLTDRLDNSK
jgi:hypothetical protein